MLVDNALNSAVYNVWNWNNGIMLLVDLVFPSSGFTRIEIFANILIILTLLSGLWAEIHVLVSQRGNSEPLFGLQMLQPWNLDSPLVLYFVYFYIFFFYYTLHTFNSSFPMCGSEVSGGFSLHFLPGVSATRGHAFNSIHTSRHIHIHTKKTSHTPFVFIVIAQDR